MRIVRRVFQNLIAVITSTTVETTAMKLMGASVTMSQSSNVSAVVVSTPLGDVMVNRIVMMAVMNLIAPNVLMVLISAPMETAFLRSSSVTISMIVRTTVMKLMAVSVTYPLSLNVLLVDASMVLGFVMVNQIALMAVMKLKISATNQQMLHQLVRKCLVLQIFKNCNYLSLYNTCKNHIVYDIRGVTYLEEMTCVVNCL